MTSSRSKANTRSKTSSADLWATVWPRFARAWSLIAKPPTPVVSKLEFPAQANGAASTRVAGECREASCTRHVTRSALESLDNLFKGTLERLDCEARIQEAIKAGKNVSVDISQHFRKLDEELLRLILERLPEPFEEQFKELLSLPQNEQARKTSEPELSGLRPAAPGRDPG